MFKLGKTSFVTVAEKTGTLVSGLDNVVSSIDAEELSSVVTSFRELLVKINDPDGTVGKLLTDDSVYKSVDELLNDVDSLVQKIQENPRKYIKISVF